MIRRLVKLKFKSDTSNIFVDIFKEKHQQILSCQGCSHLEVWQDVNDEDSFFTYSIWDSEEDLNNYRSSVLFNKLWPKVKSLFREKAEVWTLR